MAVTASHANLIIQELLPRAKAYVAGGERRLAEQEARVAEFERKGRDVEQSKKLLMVMRDTMTLQTDYVRLLEREVREAQL